MTRCEPAQHILSLACDLQDCAPFISGILCSYEEAFALRPIDEFDCAIVLQPQAFCRVGNGDDLPLRGSRNLQKELMLLWVQTCFHSRAFTEMQKAAELKTKFSQGSEKRNRAISLEFGTHIYIVTRYILIPQIFFPAQSSGGANIFADSLCGHAIQRTLAIRLSLSVENVAGQEPIGFSIVLFEKKPKG